MLDVMFFSTGNSLMQCFGFSRMCLTRPVKFSVFLGPPRDAILQAVFLNAQTKNSKQNRKWNEATTRKQQSLPPAGWFTESWNDKNFSWKGPLKAIESGCPAVNRDSYIMLLRVSFSNLSEKSTGMFYILSYPVILWTAGKYILGIYDC